MIENQRIVILEKSEKKFGQVMNLGETTGDIDLERITIVESFTTLKTFVQDFVTEVELSVSGTFRIFSLLNDIPLPPVSKIGKVASAVKVDSRLLIGLMLNIGIR